MAIDKDSLLREVDEDLRREQLEKLWEKYGLYVLIGAALIVIGVGGYKWNENRAVQQARNTGARFEQALRLGQTGKAEDEQKALAGLAKSAPGGYRALAQMRLAAADAAAGKRSEAVVGYDGVVADRSVDSILRDYARIAAATIRLDDADWTEMENRLKDLEASESPWRASARELIGLAAWKAGKPEEARRRFEALMVDKNASQNIVQRAQMMMALIAEGEVTSKAEAVPPPSPPAPAAAQPAPAPAPKSGAKRK